MAIELAKILGEAARWLTTPSPLPWKGSGAVGGTVNVAAGLVGRRCWSGILRQRGIGERSEAPWGSSFEVAFGGSLAFVMVCIAGLMVRFRGQDRAGSRGLPIAEALFAGFSGVLRLPEIPDPFKQWWCPLFAMSLRED